MSSRESFFIFFLFQIPSVARNILVLLGCVFFPSVNNLSTRYLASIIKRQMSFFLCLVVSVLLRRSFFFFDFPCIIMRGNLLYFRMIGNRFFFFRCCNSIENNRIFVFFDEYSYGGKGVWFGFTAICVFFFFASLNIFSTRNFIPIFKVLWLIWKHFGFILDFHDFIDFDFFVLFVIYSCRGSVPL